MSKTFKGKRPQSKSNHTRDIKVPGRREARDGPHFFHASQVQLKRGGRGDDLRRGCHWEEDGEQTDVHGQVAAHRGPSWSWERRQKSLRWSHSCPPLIHCPLSHGQQDPATKSDIPVVSVGRSLQVDLLSDRYTYLKMPPFQVEVVHCGEKYHFKKSKAMQVMFISKAKMWRWNLNL